VWVKFIPCASTPVVATLLIKAKLAAYSVLLVANATLIAAQPNHHLLIPYVSDSNVVADGVVETGEYWFSYLDQGTGVSVHWEHNGSFLRVGLVGPGTGWVSIGFGPRNVGMDGANMVLAYMDNQGSAVIVDEIGLGHGHYPDTERGGSDDIHDWAVSQLGNNTTAEFSLPLDSGDALDQRLQGNNTYGFFLGYHSTARDRVTYHTARSETMDVFVEPAPLGTPVEPGGFPWVAVGSVGALIILAIMYRIVRRPRIVRFRKNSH